MPAEFHETISKLVELEKFIRAGRGRLTDTDAIDDVENELRRHLRELREDLRESIKSRGITIRPGALVRGVAEDGKIHIVSASEIGA